MAQPQTAYADDDLAQEPLSGIIARVASELGAVGHLIQSLEGHLCAASRDEPLDENDRIQTLQGIDMAVQQIIGLSEFLDRLGVAIPEDVSVDAEAAFDVVKLSDMKRRLADAPDYEPGVRDAIGEIELF